MAKNSDWQNKVSQNGVTQWLAKQNKYVKMAQHSGSQNKVSMSEQLNTVVSKTK